MIKIIQEMGVTRAVEEYFKLLDQKPSGWGPHVSPRFARSTIQLAFGRDAMEEAIEERSERLRKEHHQWIAERCLDDPDFDLAYEEDRREMEGR
jgi:hypothetical protein